MTKYFIYDKEYISGWRYWFRMLLQTFLVFFFGLGIYLTGVTTYKRAKSLNFSNGGALFFAILNPLTLVVAFGIGLSGIDVGLATLVLNIPHWYLWFSNGIPPNKSADRVIKKESNSHDGLPTHLGGIKVENDNTTELPKKEKSSSV